VDGVESSECRERYACASAWAGAEIEPHPIHQHLSTSGPQVRWNFYTNAVTEGMVDLTERRAFAAQKSKKSNILIRLIYWQEEQYRLSLQSSTAGGGTEICDGIFGGCRQIFY